MTLSNRKTATISLASAAGLAMAISTLNPAIAHDGGIPIGDGKISSGPKRGYTYSCQLRFDPNAPAPLHPATGYLAANGILIESRP